MMTFRNFVEKAPDADLLREMIGFATATTGPGQLKERRICFAKPKPPIVDKLGYLLFESDAACLCIKLVSRRRERRTMLITSNRGSGIGERSSATR